MSHFAGSCIGCPGLTCALCGLLSSGCRSRISIVSFFRRLLIGGLALLLRSSLGGLGAGTLCAGMKKAFRGVEDFLIFCRVSGHFLRVFHRR